MNNKTLRRIFFCWNGKKVSIRLGRMNDNNFNYSKAMILDLIQDLSLGFSVRENVKNWLKNIPTKIYKKLAKIGLVPNQKQSVSLGEVIQIFLEAKKSIKQKTKISYEVCLKRFLKIFKSCKEISTFNEGDVDFFVENLTSRWPNASTRSKTISVVKQLFRFAHRKKIICEDCFQELKRGPMVNSSRCTYIPRHVIDSLLESIPKYHEDLRTTIILARFAGLRSPSEVVNLRWGDIDWDNNLICLQISKTAIHGHYSRVIPIFSDLKPYLEEMKKKSNPTDIYLMRNLSANKNYRNQLTKHMRKLDIKVWPRLYQNLRVSREYDMIKAGVPYHVAAAIMGHSPRVQQAHYLITTKQDISDVGKIDFKK